MGCHLLSFFVVVAARPLHQPRLFKGHPSLFITFRRAAIAAVNPRTDMGARRRWRSGLRRTIRRGLMSDPYNESMTY